MSRAFSFALAFLLLASLTLGASCQTQTVIVRPDGTQYKPEDSRESQLLQQAQDAQARQDGDSEEKAWKQLASDFPSSPMVGEGHYRLGILAAKRSAWQDAIQSLTAAFKGSLSKEKRNESLFYYGKSLAGVERYSEAIEALESAYPHLASAEKKQAQEIIIRSAERSGNRRSLLQWEIQQYASLPPDQQDARRSELLQKIEGSLSLADLRLLYMKRTDNLRFPFDAIAMRLAKVSVHSQDYAAAQEILRGLLGEIKREHPSYTEANELYNQLRRRDRDVSPRTIGVIYPKTGSGSVLGKWIRNAVTLASRDASSIQIVFKDSGSDPQKAADAVTELVREHKVIAIFGPVLPLPSKAAAYRAQELGVPLFSITYEENFQKIGDYIFRNNLTWSQMGRAIARYAFKTLQLQRFAVFYPENPPGRIQVRAFWEEILKLGGEVVGAESYPLDTQDFEDPAKRLVGRHHLQYRPAWGRLSSQLRGAEGLSRRRLYRNLLKQFTPVVDFDAIFIPDNFRYVSMIVPTLAQQDIEVKLHYPYWEKQVMERYARMNRHARFVQLLGNNGWNDERILSSEPRNIIGSIFVDRYYPRSKEAIVKQFVEGYQQSFPDQFDPKNLRPPFHYSAYTYDTIQMMLQIASKKDHPKTRSTFRDALFAIKDFVGVTGKITIQPDGQALAPVRYLIVDRQYYFRLHSESQEIIP